MFFNIQRPGAVLDRFTGAIRAISADAFFSPTDLVSPTLRAIGAVIGCRNYAARIATFAGSTLFFVCFWLINIGIAIAHTGRVFGGCD